MLPLAMSFWAKHVRTSTAMKKAACVAAAVLSLSASSVIAQTSDVSVTGIAGRSDTRAARTGTKTVSRNVPKMVAEGSLPPSRALDFINVENANSYHLGELPASVLRQGDEDDTGKRSGKRLRIGVARDLSFKLDALKNASVYGVPDGELRIFNVVSDKAKQVRLFLSDVDIPAGGRLYIYSREDAKQVFGPFTNRGVDATGQFWTPPVTGESVTVELFLPEGVKLDRPAFSVTKVNHIFLDPETIGADGNLKSDADTVETFAAGACNLNVTSAWAQVAKSVGKMQFSSTGGEYVCTGTLLNSVNNDLTPYFLTANHCISTASEAQSLRVTWFYDSVSASTQRSDGASLLKTSYQSDATLLMINGWLPTGLFWSGWSPSTINTNASFTALHHPRGDYKRITFGRKTGNYDGPDDFGNRSLHEVRWNTNGGTTEGGSSGSGLWTGTPDDARLTGNLLGGAAACENLTGADYYGRFDVTYPLVADLLAGGSDDLFEDNDARDTAREIGAGNLTGLVIKSTDDDWYRITVPVNGKRTLAILHNPNNGYIDVNLSRVGSTAVFSPVRNSDGTIELRNLSDVAIDYLVRIFIRGGNTRIEYGLSISSDNDKPCNFNVATQTAASVASSGASGNISVTSLSECTWTARSNVDWISVNVLFSPDGTSGNGSRSVTYQVAANTTSTPRTGTLTVAGQTITVTQRGLVKRRMFGSRVRSRLR
ncbi:MAG: BACON domain-containing protein [Pyrinomonadaceae bacterium MAG19_C2-C3]|nr:BACON domain-containing protein [Pyrinomonadaceae bacterium MAG19_C2-C3]